MKSVVLLICVLAWASADEQFQSFKQKFGKSYRTALEEEYRSTVFAINMKLIEEHNQLYQNGQSTFKMGVTQFADLTNSEYVATMLTPIKPQTQYTVPQSSRKLGKTIVGAAPDSIDWRDYGYVGPVGDQGRCHYSWTFATTGALEGSNFAATGIFVKLSEQNLLDCSSTVPEGCDSYFGNNEFGFLYVIQNGGIYSEEGYPTFPGKTVHEIWNRTFNTDLFSCSAYKGHGTDFFHMMHYTNPKPVFVTWNEYHTPQKFGDQFRPVMGHSVTEI